MILELDVGNSRIKWRLLDASMAVASQGHVADIEELQQSADLQQPISAARMCSVRSAQDKALIASWVNKRYGIDLLQAVVTQSCAGVTNQYADVSSLGIDRWLAMLAAYKKADGACVIVDAGTAFTIDLLDARGLHLGGYILPGLSLMRRSLESTTAIRLTPAYVAKSQTTGHSTDQAVSNGILTALLALIHQLLGSLAKQGVTTKLYFTGGDAELLHGHAMVEGSEVVSSLVFEGLAIACPFPRPQPSRH